MNTELEESLIPKLDFNKINSIAKTGASVLPVIVQDFHTKEVLTLAYANAEALEETLRTRMAVFWSTSRNELWRKGETSGSWLEVISIRINCEQNSLLYLVSPVSGGVCHTKNKNGEYRRTCYYRQVEGFPENLDSMKLEIAEKTLE